MWTWAIAAAVATAEADPERLPTRKLAVGIEAGDPASVRQLVTRLVWLEDAVQALQSELAEIACVAAQSELLWQPRSC